MLSLIRPSRIVAIAVILAVPALITNCSRIAYGVLNVPARLGSYERHADIRYGELPRQSLDVYVPTGAAQNRAVVVFWYGGAWIKGSKDLYRFVGAALANTGYVAILADYRLYPAAHFPDFLDDGALAVKWARAHAREYGGNPQEIFVMGHSAGGHLAATLALDERYLKKVGGDASWIRGWIAISAPYGLEMRVPLLGAIFAAHPSSEWQPMALVTARSPPALILHGLDDYMVHPREAVAMGEKLSAAGVSVLCHLYEGAGHTQPVAALSLTLRREATTLADIRAFIDRTAAGKPSASEPCNSIHDRKTWRWENPPRPLGSAATGT